MGFRYNSTKLSARVLVATYLAVTPISEAKKQLQFVWDQQFQDDL